MRFTELTPANLSKDITGEDPVLAEVCRRISRDFPAAKSVILSGSRALGTHVEDRLLKSDYDITVVMSTAGALVHLRRLKKLEVELAQQFGIEISINPLPTFRLRRPRGNFLLFKYGREALTLQGEDYLRDLRSMQPEDIGLDWHFLYLSSMMKRLLSAFDPELTTRSLSTDEGRLISYQATKSLFGCAEILLLRTGVYESTPEQIVQAASIHLTDRKSGFANASGWIDDLKYAFDVIGADFECADPVGLWFRVSERALEAFEMFANDLQPDETSTLAQHVERTLDMRLHPRIARNGQYFLSNLLLRREVFWKALLMRRSVDSRIRASLVLLLASLTSDGKVDCSKLEAVRRLLQGCANVYNGDSDEENWRVLKASTLTYFPHACRALGV